MTVNKYRTFEEAHKAIWRFETNDSYFKELRRLFEFFGRINPPGYPSGIFKHKDLDSANRQIAEWDVLNGLNKVKRIYKREVKR